MVGREVPQLSIYRPLHNALKYIAYDKGWMEQNPFPNPFGSLEGLFKGIQKWTKVAHVAANPTAHRNAWLANSLALSLKHGDPAAVLKAMDWGLDFKRWQSGMPTRYPAELHEAMLRNDLLNSGFVAAEIPKTELGLAGQALTKPTDAVIKLFDIPDTVFKGYDTVNGMGRYLKEWESLPVGERMTLPISRQRSLEVTKRAPTEAGLSDMVLRGKQLTRSQMMGVIARSAAEPAARTFVNFNHPVLLQAAKRNIPLWDALFGTPYSGWLSATTTIPGRQGIVGEVLSGAVSRGGTTSRRLMMKRNAEAAAHGFLIYAIMGAEAAQRDPNSAVHRQAAAFSPDDVTPTIAYPTDTPGKYQLWRLGSADPLEDIHTTLRMLETARSAFDAGLGYIDPTEVSLMTDEERAKLSTLPPEEVRNLSPSERALYDAAKGLEKASSVGGMNIKHVADLAYIGGSTIADAYMNFVDMRGIPGEGIAPGLAFVKKLALRTIIPGFVGKYAAALNEHEIPRLEDRLVRAAGIEDAEEKREVIAELTQDLAIARYLAGSRGRRKSDAWDFDAMSPDPSVHERAARDFTDTVMNHMFNSPRVELMVGKNRRERGSKTERMYREMKTRAVAAVNDRARESIKELQALLDAARAAREEAQHEVRQAELDKQIGDMRVSIRETKSRFDRISKMVEDEFRIRTDALIQDSLRDSTLRSGFKRGAKVLEEHSAGKRGLRKSLERRPQRQEEAR